MLGANIVFMVIGVGRTRHLTEKIGVNAGACILIGFALLAMGSLTPLFGAFRLGA